MNSETLTIEHPSHRLVVALPDSYEAARATYEALVPEVDHAAYASAHSWQDTLAIAEKNAPHGFMRYFAVDIAPIMTGSQAPWRATQYLMGNHTIAERMFRHDPSVMLHAPLRTLLYVDAAGVTRFAADQPSLLFASYGNPEITAVGLHLDSLLATLFGLLGAQVPASLEPKVAT